MLCFFRSFSLLCFLFILFCFESTHSQWRRRMNKNKNPIRMATNHYTHSSSSEASVLRNIFCVFGLRFDIKLQVQIFYFCWFQYNPFCWLSSWSTFYNIKKKELRIQALDDVAFHAAFHFWITQLIQFGHTKESKEA